MNYEILLDIKYRNAIMSVYDRKILQISALSQ